MASIRTNPECAPPWEQSWHWPPLPNGFSTSEFASQVRAITGQNEQEYGARRAAYDLKKIRVKDLVTKVGLSRHY